MLINEDMLKWSTYSFLKCWWRRHDIEPRLAIHKAALDHGVILLHVRIHHASKPSFLMPCTHRLNLGLQRWKWVKQTSMGLSEFTPKGPKRTRECPRSSMVSTFYWYYSPLLFNPPDAKKFDSIGIN